MDAGRAPPTSRSRRAWSAGARARRVPFPVRQPVAVPEDVAGAVVDLQDPPAPVQMNDAHPRTVEQAGHGRASRPGAHQRLADADELPDVARH